MDEVHPQQATREHHQQLLSKILSSFDQVLDFDPKTKGLKPWAW